MEQKKRKIPERQCLGCNVHAPKLSLLRVVRDPEGNVSLDFKGKKSGRGAYICKNVECLRKARKNRRISSNLKCEIPDAVWEEMERELSEYDSAEE
ncbi:MAG: YlxR family protein [Clostridia bacterium]|nr:YlxR family protein [Clostridia bacterium]